MSSFLKFFKLMKRYKIRSLNKDKKYKIFEILIYLNKNEKLQILIFFIVIKNF